MSWACGLGRGVADNGFLGRMDHGGVVDIGEVSVDEVKPVATEQSGPDGLDLHVGERLPNAAVPTCSERDVAELLLRCGATLVQEPEAEWGDEWVGG
jgi:hypothetical protein